MDTHSWTVQIYSMADAHCQAFVARLLRQHEVTVSTAENDTDHFVIADCENDDKARWVFEFVMSIDIDAVLLHTSNAARRSPSEPREFV